MGLNNAAVTFLCAAKASGVDFTETVMLGRQGFYPEPAVLKRGLDALSLATPHDLLGKCRYAEPFFRLLGARNVASLDASAFEGASHVHDLNAPLPDALSEQFTAVFDGGTLEHVFNYPQAIKSAMQMVRVGGCFLQIAPANNYMGHGFWQISPELIYRIFSAGNGFRVHLVLLHERDRGWYAVDDPKDTGGRIQLSNKHPTYILTIAERIGSPEIFAKAPQQSDYVPRWNGVGPHGPLSPGARLRRSVAKRVNRLFPRPFDRPYFRQLTEAELLSGATTMRRSEAALLTQSVLP